MNAIYNLTKYKMMTGAFDWRTLDLRVFVFTGDPDFNPTDTIVNDILARSGVLLGVSQAILNPAVLMDGTGKSSDALVPNVLTGEVITWMVLANHAPVENNSQLVAYIDEAENLPFMANGLDVLIKPDWLQNRGWVRP